MTEPYALESDEDPVTRAHWHPELWMAVTGHDHDDYGYHWHCLHAYPDVEPRRAYCYR